MSYSVMCNAARVQQSWNHRIKRGSIFNGDVCAGMCVSLQAGQFQEQRQRDRDQL